jgi:exodeoxyribonuclease VII small subunit
MATKKTTKFNFEAAIKELEEIVSALEKGGLTLEDSLNIFAKGVALTKECQQTLKAAEQQVKILMGKNLTDFETLENDEEASE